MPLTFFRAAALWTGIAVIGCSAAGCGPRKPAPPPIVRIGLVAGPAGFGDHGFNDAARAGLVQCNRETGVTAQTAAPGEAGDAEAKLVLFATQKFDTIVGIGYGIAPALQTVARRFDGSHFAIIDALAGQPNVESLTFRVQDGAFLAGALAARVSRTRHIAFIGGADVPLLQRSEAGFRAGAREIDPNVRVSTAYLTSFTDPFAARATAERLLAGGADIVFVIAGPAGLGAFKAVAARRGAFAIGADTDQDAIVPGKILTSVVKGVGAAVLRVCRETVGGKPETGAHEMGLADGGIGLTDFAYTRAQIGAATIARIDRLRAAIVAGRIAVPNSRAALAAFVPVAVP
jgi:basic membrane protein A